MVRNAGNVSAGLLLVLTEHNNNRLQRGYRESISIRTIIDSLCVGR